MTAPRHHRRPQPNAEPGTGTQYYVEASPPCGCHARMSDEDCDDINHKHPTTYRWNGRRWKVGHDYLDVDRADVVELTSVVRKSAWCDTGPAEEGTLEFHFEGERIGSFTVDVETARMAMDETDPTARFIERYESPRPMSAPAPPW